MHDGFQVETSYHKFHKSLAQLEDIYVFVQPRPYLGKYDSRIDAFS